MHEGDARAADPGARRLVDEPQAALDSLRDRGLQLIDETPRTGIRGSRVAFVHPASSGGVLTEIVQPSEGH